MYLYKRGRYWWAEFTVDGKRKRVSTKLSDKRAAEERAPKLLREAERRAAGEVDLYRDHAQAPVEEHLGAFTEHLRAKGTSAAHLRDRVAYVRGFLTWAGAKTYTEVDPVDVDRWLSHLRLRGAQSGGPLSARSVNKRAASLRHFGRWLVKVRRAPFNLFAALPMLNEEEDRHVVRRPPSEDEVGAVLATAPFERSVCYLLAATSGLRRAELRALRWADVELEAGRFRARASTTKNRKKATLPLHPLTRLALGELLRRRRAGLSTRGTGNFARPDQGAEPAHYVFNSVPVVATLKRDLKRAGVPFETMEGRLDLHAFRHGLATLLCKAGVSMALAKKLMRHSTIALTSRIYTHLQLDDATEAVGKLGTSWVPSWDEPEQDQETTVGQGVGETRPPSVIKRSYGHSETGAQGVPEDKWEAPEAAVYAASGALGATGLEPVTHGLKGHCSTD